MSDLLQLVAATLNDRVALDAKKEIDELGEKLSAAYAVEVIRRSRDEGQSNGPERDGVEVYSSVPFQSGRYGKNPRYWEVGMQQSSSGASSRRRVCRLGDLEECLVCVGGGFPLTDFSRHNSITGWLDESSDDGDDCKSLMLTFPHAPIWIDVLVEGWPREAWEAKIRADDLDPEECIPYLVDEVAVRYPRATIRVTNIAFNTVCVHPAMKRLLPPRLREEARAEVDGRVARSDGEKALVGFACTTLRNANPSCADPALYGIYARDILRALRELGITERSSENDELVTALIDARVTAGLLGGRDNLDRFVELLVEARAGSGGGGGVGRVR